MISFENFRSLKKVFMLFIILTFYRLENLLCWPFYSFYIIWKQFLWWLSTHSFWLYWFSHFRNYFLTDKNDRSLLVDKTLRESEIVICLIDIRLKLVCHLELVLNHSLLMTSFNFKQGCLMLYPQLTWIELHQVVFYVIILRFNFFLYLINFTLNCFHRPKSCFYFCYSFRFFTLLLFNY